MTSTERVALRLTSETVVVLETLVDSGEFSDIHDVLMAALSEFISRRFKAEDIRRILDSFSNKASVDPESLMVAEKQSDLDEVVRAAVGNYVRSRMEDEHQQFK